MFAQESMKNPDTMMYHANTMELYFETEDFESFIALLDQYPDVKRLHEPKTFPWLQRGIRIYEITVKPCLHVPCFLQVCTIE